MTASSQRCSRGSRVCVYPSDPRGTASEYALSVAWVESIDAPCQTWKDCGVAPFPSLMVPSSLDWHGLDARGLRYFYFIASHGATLVKNNTRQFCLWWEGYEVGLQIAAKVDYVAYVQIVLAANRLGKITKLSSVLEDAVHYKTLALRGLRRALASFSKENADGVAAASISLMFQQETPADWERVTKGTEAVIRAMRPWAKMSALEPILKHIYLDEDELMYNVAEHREEAESIAPIAMVTLESAAAAVEFLLGQGIASLNRLATCTRSTNPLLSTVRELGDTLRLAQARQSASSQRHDGFWLAYPFCDLNNRTSLNFDEISSLKPFVLLVLAHMYSAMVVLSMLYPELDRAGLIAIRLHSLDALTRHFQSVQCITCEACSEIHSVQEFLTFPQNAVRAYRQRRMSLQSSAFENPPLTAAGVNATT